MPTPQAWRGYAHAMGLEPAQDIPFRLPPPPAGDDVAAVIGWFPLADPCNPARKLSWTRKDAVRFIYARRLARRGIIEG